MGDLGAAFGGGPSGASISRTRTLLQSPDRRNYQIAGIPEYQNQMTQLGGLAQGIANNGAGNYNAGAVNAGLANQAAAANLIGQTARGQGPSLARANMMAGLAQQNNALASQAMTNQGNTGGGLSQRNLLNAQANAGNNMLQNAGVASVAEQLGAQSNYASAANAQTQGQMQNALNASNVGLSQNQQRLIANQTAAANATAGQQQNMQQAQNNMNFDAARQQSGRDHVNIELQGLGADAAQLGAIGSTLGNIAGGAASFIHPAAKVASDEKTKEAVRQGTATDAQIGKFLSSFAHAGEGGGDSSGAGGASRRPLRRGENPFTDFTPGLLTGGGIQMGGGSQTNYKGLALSGAGGALGGMLGNAVMKRPGDEMAGAIEARPALAQIAPGTAPQDMGMVHGGSLGAPLPPEPTAVYRAPTSMKSDERAKTASNEASPQQLSSFMRAMEPSTFEYKDQSYSPGQHMGVMAQDVDNSRVGADMVSEGADGMKQISVPKALGATLASLAYLNEKVDALSKKRGK